MSLIISPARDLIISKIPDAVTTNHICPFLSSQDRGLLKIISRAANQRVKYDSMEEEAYSRVSGQYIVGIKKLENLQKALQDRSNTYIGKLVSSLNSKIQTESNALFKTEFEEQKRLKDSIINQQTEIARLDVERLKVLPAFRKYQSEMCLMNILGGGGRKAFTALPELSAEEAKRISNSVQKKISKIFPSIIAKGIVDGVQFVYGQYNQLNWVNEKNRTWWFMLKQEPIYGDWHDHRDIEIIKSGKIVRNFESSLTLSSIRIVKDLIDQHNNTTKSQQNT